MPIFEYRCRECGAKFERIVSSTADPATCKNCSSSRAEKLLSVFTVAGASRSAVSMEPGPCGACEAPRRGMCEE